MGIPLIQQLRIGGYLIKQRVMRRERYPLAMMLEPLFQCNLACAGCGKIDHPDEILKKRVSVEDALKAVDDCGAPVVSIPGGEPLIHDQMPEIVRGIVARKKFVYLCTNALLLKRKIESLKAVTRTAKIKFAIRKAPIKKSQNRSMPDLAWHMHLLSRVSSL